MFTYKCELHSCRLIPCLVCVFTPKQCTPLDIYECGDSTAILGAVFMKNLDTAASIASNEDCWSKELTLYFLNQDQVTDQEHMHNSH